MPPAPTETDPQPAKLSPGRQRFVEEYLVDLNAKRAAIRAGYSPKTAQSIGSALLNIVDVAEAIERGKEERRRRVEMTQADVLNEMAVLSHSSLTHYRIDDSGHVVPADGAPEGCMRAIRSMTRKLTILPDGTRNVDVTLQLWDKPGPLKLMGRHLSLFPDRVEVVGAGGGPVQTENVTRIERVVIDGNGDGRARSKSKRKDAAH